MKKFIKKSASVISAAALTLGAVNFVPYSEVTEAADELQTRDVWCANEDVNRWESEHFQFIWGKNGADSSKITQSFLEENAKHLEACWDVYMNELSMEPPTQSVNMGLRDGKQYKVNFYISGTGLRPFTDDWAYMGYDSQGYAFMFCCVGAMQNSPNPSWVLPHEFGHVVTAHQLGWNDNKYVQAWWEAIGNWYREQFLYSNYYQQWVNDPASGTDYFETYMKNLCFTPILGRDNYASWAFLQYLTENPDNLDGYGSDFIKNLMQQGNVNEYPYLEIDRLAGADLKDTLGHYAKRMATLDLKMQDRYKARQNELFSRGDWNWGEIYTLLEKSGKNDNYYTVPTERAPQQMGLNIVPLNVTGNSVKVNLEGLTSVKGADWRACLVIEQKDGKTRYSDLFASGGSASMTFDSNTDSAAYLTVTATPDVDTLMQVGVPWAYSEGEFDENNYPFLSKTRYPYAVTIDGAEIKQSIYDHGYGSADAMSNGHTHPNGGGFVASSARVDDSVYVGKNAKILGNATVSGNAVIDGYAIVTGNSAVSGNAVITGHAVVAERAQVRDNAIVGDYAGVMGNSVISENARVLESGLVFNDYNVSGNATVKGVAYCMANGSASGQAMPDGDYYDDSGRSIQAGSVYGWTSPDSYVNSRPYNDGQYAGLEFDSDSSEIAYDTFTSTYAASYGSPIWNEEKTSARGVITFTGDQYLVADNSYAALHDADYQTAVLLRDNGENSIFRFGNDEEYMSLTADNGNFVFEINDGSGTQSITTENAYELGAWTKVSVVINDDSAKLIVNGETAASGSITADPVDIVSEDAVYLIGDGMNGSMDYFRVNFKEVAEPDYVYTEKEEITIPSGQVLIGDLDLDMKIDSFDLILMRKAVIDPSLVKSDLHKAVADVNGDNEVNIADVVTMQNYLLGKIKEFPAGTIITY
ncbi:MAG: DUF6055 domain-containing protein [Ruminococcus flavefaciens]|nr:DUF6055 domain-containing protein [Ruminococcus flavefaciens]MCM1058924.1 DUF6055 domain-containing protein [Eubacterium sp.]